MRKLKFHEKKLLKKVNFLEWKREGGHRENLVMQRYHVTGRDDYKKYSGLCRMVQKLVNVLKQMDTKDPFRIDMTDKLLEKLYNMGVIPTRQSITLCERLTVSSFCRHRLSSVLVRLKFAEHLKEAVTYIEQGHVRVGPEIVTDPAFLVTRNMEDFITWVDSSKIKRKSRLHVVTIWILLLESRDPALGGKAQCSVQSTGVVNREVNSDVPQQSLCGLGVRLLQL